MNIEKFFDFICAKHDAQGESFKFDGKKVTPKIAENVIVKSLQAFMHQVGQANPANKEAKIQAFQGSSTLPQLTKDVFNVTMAVDNFDLLWQKVFRAITLKKGQLSWEICDVASSIIFKLIPEGGKVEFEKITGDKAIVDINKYGAGLGITWETIEGRKLYKFVEQMRATRAALYTLWANIHYGLLATAGATNPISYATAGATVLENDILTLNNGALALTTAVKDSGYGDMANARLEIFASPSLRARFNAAFRATNSIVAGGQNVLGQVIDFNITPNYTYNSNIPANKALLVLPGQKIQNSVYMRELGLSKREIESLNELRTYWTAFGATVGDNDQVYELAFA